MGARVGVNLGLADLRSRSLRAAGFGALRRCCRPGLCLLRNGSTSRQDQCGLVAFRVRRRGCAASAGPEPALIGELIGKRRWADGWRTMVVQEAGSKRRPFRLVADARVGGKSGAIGVVVAAAALVIGVVAIINLADVYKSGRLVATDSMRAAAG